MNKKLILLAVVGVIVLGGVLFFISTAEAPSTVALPPNVTPVSTNVTYTFITTAGTPATISYPVQGAEVAAVTVAGQSYIVTRAETESGVRYQTTDGSVVYIENMGIATLEIDGAIVAQDAVVYETESVPTPIDCEPYDEDCDVRDGVAPAVVSPAVNTLDATTVASIDGTTHSAFGGNITFSGERYSLSFGCNTISGEYELEDGQVVLKEAVTTEMACLDEVVAAQEAAFASRMRSGRVMIDIAGTADLSPDAVLQAN